MTASDIKKWQILVESALLAENTQQIEKIIKSPFEITQIAFVDPAVWANAQVKKAVLRNILKDIQSNSIEDKTYAVHMFDDLKRLNCPWPEIEVLETHINEIDIDKHFNFEQLNYYIMDTLRYPWHRIEPLVLKDPELAYNYTRVILLHSWPEAEPIIMTDPESAYNYAVYVLKHPWPQAESVITTVPTIARAYKKFVDKFNKNNTQTIKENADQVEKIKNNPFEITQMASVDAAVWTNSQAKKAIIKYILDNVQSSNAMDNIDAVHVFDNLKRLNCPWPELSVLDPRIDEISKNFDIYFNNRDRLNNYIFARRGLTLKHPWPRIEPFVLKHPRTALNYALNVLKNPWPQGELTIMKDPYEACEYALSFKKGPWPEAEPYIMTDPYESYRYARYVLKRPWPKAASIIKNSLHAQREYQRFVNDWNAANKQPLKENAEHIEKIIKNPYLITQTKIDPAIWSNNQVKKSVIKYILDRLKSDNDEKEIFKIIRLFYRLKRLKCPWPELNIINNYIVDSISNINPKSLKDFAEDVLKKRWPEAEPYIMKDPYAAVWYARYVIKGPWPEAEPTIMKNPIWAYIYARDVLKGPWPEAEPIIMSDPTYAYAYAEFVLKRPWPQAEPTIMKDPDAAKEYKKFVKKFNKNN